MAVSQPQLAPTPWDDDFEKARQVYIEERDSYIAFFGSLEVGWDEGDNFWTNGGLAWQQAVMSAKWQSRAFRAGQSARKADDMGWG